MYIHLHIRIYMLSLKPLANQAQKGKGPLSQVENHTRPMTKTVIKHYGGMHPQGE